MDENLEIRRQEAKEFFERYEKHKGYHSSDYKKIFYISEAGSSILLWQRTWDKVTKRFINPEIFQPMPESKHQED